MKTSARQGLQRIALAALGLAALSVALFVLLDLTPGRAYDEQRLDGSLSAAAAEARDPAHRPAWPIKYAQWLRHAMAGDLGDSLSYGRPVVRLVRERLVYTLWLALPALALAWAVALPLGLWMAVRAGCRMDRALLGSSAAVMAVPDVVLAFLLLWATVRLGVWQPVSLMPTGTSDAPNVFLPFPLVSLVPPVLLVVLATLPSLLRQVRLTALGVLGEPFVHHLRGRGLSMGRVVRRHVLRAALPPLLTLFSSSLALAMGGALVAEVMFSWPGVGSLLYRAALTRDEPLVAGAILVTAVCVTIVNLCGELLTDRMDPRLARP